MAAPALLTAPYTARGHADRVGRGTPHTAQRPTDAPVLSATPHTRCSAPCRSVQAAPSGTAQPPLRTPLAGSAAPLQAQAPRQTKSCATATAAFGAVSAQTHPHPPTP